MSRGKGVCTGDWGSFGGGRRLGFAIRVRYLVDLRGKGSEIGACFVEFWGVVEGLEWRF